MNQQEDILEKIICLERIMHNPVCNTSHHPGVAAEQQREGIVIVLTNTSQQRFVGWLT
jgi:hypothetical protein